MCFLLKKNIFAHTDQNIKPLSSGATPRVFSRFWTTQQAAWISIQFCWCWTFWRSHFARRNKIVQLHFSFTNKSLCTWLQLFQNSFTMNFILCFLAILSIAFAKDFDCSIHNNDCLGCIQAVAKGGFAHSCSYCPVDGKWNWQLYNECFIFLLLYILYGINDIY